jgi:hypothetical protein
MAISALDAAKAAQPRPSDPPPMSPRVSAGISAIAKEPDGALAFVHFDDARGWQQVKPGASDQAIPITDLPEYAIGGDGAWHLIKSDSSAEPPKLDGRYLLDENNQPIGLIAEVNHQPVKDVADLERKLAALPPGTKVEFTVWDHGTKVALTRTLPQPRPIDDQSPYALRNLNAKDQKELADWAGIIHKNAWLLPKAPIEKAAWLALGKAVENAVATGDWHEVDAMVGQNPKLRSEVIHDLHAWHAYWATHPAQAAKPKPAPDQAAIRAAITKRENAKMAIDAANNKALKYASSTPEWGEAHKNGVDATKLFNEANAELKKLGVTDAQLEALG